MYDDNDSNNKNVQPPVFWKAISTMVIWAMVVGAFALTGVFFAPVMGEDAIGIIFLLLVAAIVSMGFVWDWGQVAGKQSRRERRSKRRDDRRRDEDDYYVSLYQEDGAGKRKRDDRLSQALRDLSDDELVRLRERLASGEISEDDLGQVLRDEY